MTSARKTLMKVNGRRFTARQVLAACGITQHILTNILSKSPLVLVSESGGQGRPRKYTLIDVYQIRLLSLLSSLTGKMDWSARALNNTLFEKGIPEEVLEGQPEGDEGPNPHRWWDRFSGQHIISQNENPDFARKFEEFRDTLSDNILVAPESYWGTGLFLLAADRSISGGRRPRLESVEKKGLPTYLGCPLNRCGIFLSVSVELAEVDRALVQTLPEVSGDA